MSLSEIDTGASSHEDELVRAELDEARRKRRTGRARIVGTLVSVAVIGAVFAFALPRIADYGDVWDEIRKLSWQWLVVLGLATLLNLATYGPPLMAALPGLSYFHASRVTLASTALSVIAPGGAAAGMATTVAMLRARLQRPPRRARRRRHERLEPVGDPRLPDPRRRGPCGAGARNRTLEIAALVGLAVFAVIVAGFAIALSSERLANRVGDRAARLVSAAGRLLHKAPVKWNGASFVHFRDESIELIRRRWLFLTAATLAGHLTVFLVLAVSLRAVGVTHTEVTIVEAFAAWTLARILGAIPITPGGVGFVELGLTAVLVAFGASNAEAVAGTMIYRFLTVVPTVLLGLVAAGASVVGRKPGETAVTKPATEASRLSGRGRSRPGWEIAYRQAAGHARIDLGGTSRRLSRQRQRRMTPPLPPGVRATAGSHRCDFGSRHRTAVAEVGQAGRRGRGRVFGQREEEALAWPVPARRLRPLEDVPVQLRGGLGVADRGEDAAELDARMGGGPGRTRSLGGRERAALELFGVAHLRARGRRKRVRTGRTRRGPRSLRHSRARVRDGTRPWRPRRRSAARRPTHRAASP